MAHPKSRTSKSRKNKRRKNIAISNIAFRTCKTTGVNHIPHRAYIVNGDTYYKGKIIIKNTK
ncbi:MAG: 50S ribosomal protein L32 [Bacteroides sp.]|nr:MAG: 50S ribosomal protein L32 [Bacteroides sp.]